MKTITSPQINVFVLSPHSVYGKTEFPEYVGYEYTEEFRPPGPDEWYLDRTFAVVKATWNLERDAPRLIMKKASEPEVRFTFWRNGRANPGDWVKTATGNFIKIIGSTTNEDYPVYLRTEVRNDQ